MNIKQIQQMMKQAQSMQSDMQKIQDEIDKKDFTGMAGGDMVNVVLKGTKEIQTIDIKEELFDPEEKELLQDMIKIAINQAIEKINKEVEEKMGPLTNGMGLPF